ncbi:MAG: WD40 repeat domain-containing protein [Planctomycetaceae bacterium]|nr:WD40 repeat domain-containing protein [Planctomycetaceae bacterium]
MLRRDVLIRLGLQFPAAALGVAGYASGARAVVPAQAQPSVKTPDRTIELEIDPETQEAAVPSSVAVHPNGQILAAGGDDHRIRLWNIADGSLLAQLREHTDWVRSVAFHPSGKQLASGGDDYQVLLWNLETHEIVRRWSVATGVVHLVAFRPDGKLLAAAGFDDVVRLYDTQSGALAHQLTTAASDVHALAFSPNNQQLAAAGRNGVVRIWNLSDYRVAADVPAHRMRLRAIAYSPDGGQFATAGDDRKLFLWNADGSRAAALAAPPGKVFSLAFLGSDVLAMGGSDNVIRVLDVQTRRELAQLTGHSGSVAALDYHRDSGLLASAAFDTSVRLWTPGESTRSPSKVTQLPTAAPPRRPLTK